MIFLSIQTKWFLNVIVSDDGTIGCKWTGSPLDSYVPLFDIALHLTPRLILVSFIPRILQSSFCSIWGQRFTRNRCSEKAIYILMIVDLVECGPYWILERLPDKFGKFWFSFLENLILIKEPYIFFR